MLFYDFEVFKYDWLTVILDMESEKETVIVNDAAKMEEFYKQHRDDIWAGFNSTHYDQYILKAVLWEMDPKAVSDFIIEQDKPGWMYSNLFRSTNIISYDVMLGGDRGLKSFEGFMGNNIKESSIPFNVDRKLTQAEIEETIKYCRHDVQQTVQVFLRRLDEFNTMMYFIRHFKFPLDFLSKTKAQLAAVILGGNKKGWTFDDEFEFPILDCIRLGKYRHIADWYRQDENHDYDKSQSEVVAGVPHTFSWGGGHGALKQYHAKGVFMIIDVTAYYPSLQKKYHFGYRVMNCPENFEFIHDSNIEYKRKGDKKARQPFKIMDNAISGQMKQKSSTLYDPMSNNSICINGQLLLLDLIEHLEKTGTCSLIQNNTDGIIIKVDDYERSFDIIDDTVYEWEKRTGMAMEFDTFFGEIYQKDVNNYLLVDRETGALKVKGEYLKKLSELDYDLPIVNKAVVDFMVNGKSIESTILNCDELMEFQIVRKISGLYKCILYGGVKENYRAVNPATGKMKTYERLAGKRVPLKERCIRVFASTDPNDGGLWKEKNDGSIAKLESTPERSFIFNENVHDVKCPAKLDKQWYINAAADRLRKFGVDYAF